MTTLYIKTHKITGLKYFGKTTFDPFTYNGSGSYWKDHLKIHGKYIATKIYAEFEDGDAMLVETALKFSADNDIVKSKQWANEIPENGLDGCPRGVKRSEETKQKMRKPKSKVGCQNMSAAAKTRKYTEEGRKKRSVSLSGKGNPMYGVDRVGKMPSGNNHHWSKLISICDAKGNIMYECNGDFERVCKENNLPFSALKKSYQTRSTVYNNIPKRTLSLLTNNGLYQKWCGYSAILTEKQLG